MKIDAATLASLAAKQEITEQLFRYSRSMDRIDNEIGKRVWHPDGTADYGELFAGTGHGWIEHVSKLHAEGTVATSHLVSNILIELDGTKATSECYVAAILQSNNGARRSQSDIRGRYLDRWSYREGRWAIDHRQYVHDLSHSRDAHGEGCMFRPWGHRDARDPSYELCIVRR